MALETVPLRNYLQGTFDSEKSEEVSFSYKPGDSETTKIIAFPKPAKPGSNWEEWDGPQPSAEHTQLARLRHIFKLQEAIFFLGPTTSVEESGEGRRSCCVARGKPRGHHS